MGRLDKRTGVDIDRESTVAYSSNIRRYYITLDRREEGGPQGALAAYRVDEMASFFCF